MVAFGQDATAVVVAVVVVDNGDFDLRTLAAELEELYCYLEDDSNYDVDSGPFPGQYMDSDELDHISAADCAYREVVGSCHACMDGAMCPNAEWF